MAVEIIECEQGSEEWFKVRLGIPTASEFGKVLAIKKDAREKVTRTKYLYQLAAETISGELSESYTNRYMERGHEWEDEARNLYAFMTDDELVPVGFIRDIEKGAGASPDSLIGSSNVPNIGNGCLEIKTKTGALLVECIVSGKIPPEHVPQLQGQLWVAELDYVQLVIFSRGLPLVTHRVERDEDKIMDIAAAVRQFNAELAETIGRVMRYDGTPEALRAELKASLAVVT